MDKVRWGVLSTAKIAREKVIPGIKAGSFCDVTAIASRNYEQAKETADKLQIEKAYGSYDELLGDENIDAVYIPLPNQLHVPWAIKAIKAGKHVLCEKPVALTTEEAVVLLEAARAKPHLKVMEAFMYRFHPQWVFAKKAVEDGKLGELITIQSVFSYFNLDPNNIRNKENAGGGGLMDIGCYCISLARFLYGKEPIRVFGRVEFDPNFKVDKLASGILEFEKGSASFTCATQMTPYQRVNIFGTNAGIEIEIPFNAPPDKSTRCFMHSPQGKEEVVFDSADQYTLQADLFSQAILNDTPVPTPLEDAVSNMRVIEGIFQSAREGCWVEI